MKSLIGKKTNSADLSGVYYNDDNLQIRDLLGEIERYTYTKSSPSLTSFPYGVVFKPDGTKLYTLDPGADLIYQYSLSTPWDVTTVTTDNKSLSIVDKTGAGEGLSISPDGTRVYVISGTSNVFEWYLSTPWDISTGKFANIKTLSTGEGNTYAMAISSDGTKFYSVGYNSDTVRQFNLSTPYDISTGSSAAIYGVNTQDGAPYGLYFKPDGTKFYVLGGVNNRVFQYSMSTAWSVSTASYDNKSFLVSGQDTSPREIGFNNDGTILYIIGDTNDRIYQYSLSTAWDVSTASYSNKSFSVTTQETSPQAIAFKSDGTKMYVGGFASDSIYQYSLSTAWDVSTATYDSKKVSVLAQEGGLTGMAISADGTKLFITGDSVNDFFTSYELEEAWDISSTNIGTYVVAEDGGATDIVLNSSGTKMYVVGNTNNRIYQYTLKYPFKIFSATYDGVSLNVTSQDTTPNGICFNDAGDKLLITGFDNDRIYQYNLSNTSNISTGTYINSLYFTNLETTCRGITISSDSTKIYIIGDNVDKIHQFDINLF